jgi:hypothetical protein
MKYPTWSQFINNHPDKDELRSLSAEIISMINPTETTTINIGKLSTTTSLVAVTLDPFNKQLTPTFFHHRLGLPILNQRPRLIALTGFGKSAITLEIDADSLFSATDTEITTPSLAQFMSFHDKDSEQLKSITIDDNEKHLIKKAAILPPDVSTLFMSSQTSCPWVLLFQAITIITQMKPELPSTDLTEDDNLAYAKPFLPLLHTLWAFTQSTTETQEMIHPPRSICTDSKATNWNNKLHEENINQTNPNLPPTPTNQNQSSESIAEGINRLAKSLEDKNNDRFASTEDETEEKESKGWKKLDETLKKIILFASSTDGESAASAPTDRLKALINTKNGALVSRLINSWHDLDIVVQTGMASNIQKGCIISSNGPFSINTFSPFFVPAVRAGFNIISHDELNCLDFASQSNNLTSKDIEKMVYSHPYIPTEPYLFIAQIQNFHAVLSDVLGEKSLIAISIEDVISHFNKNELLYYNIFSQEPHFAVWFLNQIHFKVQQIIHQCASAASVQDVQFNLFTLDDELKSIGTNNVLIRAPTWFIQMKAAEARKHNNQTGHGSGLTNNNNNRQNNNNNEKPQEKRRTISNNNIDTVTKIKEDETYGFIVHHQNLRKHRKDEATIDGISVCNNWHMRGWCTDGCRRSTSHKKLSGETLEKYRAYVAKLRASTTEFANNLKKGKKGRPSSVTSNPNINPPFENETKSSTGETQ